MFTTLFFFTEKRHQPIDRPKRPRQTTSVRLVASPCDDFTWFPGYVWGAQPDWWCFRLKQKQNMLLVLIYLLVGWFVCLLVGFNLNTAAIESKKQILLVSRSSETSVATFEIISTAQAWRVAHCESCQAKIGSLAASFRKHWKHSEI